MKKSTLIKINAGIILFLAIYVYFQPNWSSVSALILFIGTFLAFFINNETEEDLKTKLKNRLNNKSLSRITKIIKKLDIKVLEKIRSLNIEGLYPEELNDKYNIFFESFSSRKKLEIRTIIELINNNEFNPIVPDDEDFLINVESKLHEITLQNYNGSQVVIKNPKLMWECSCNGDIKKNKDTCPIHKNFNNFKKARKFSKDFRERLVKIKYDGIEVFWKDEKDLWPPSIDSFNLISDLRNNDYDKKKIKSVLDVGTGTGFLGLWLAKKNKHVNQVSFSDWLLLPLLFSYTNFRTNNINQDVRFLLGLNTSFPLNDIDTSTKYDLVICNPPYLPELGFKKIAKHSTVAGTQLLKSIIKSGLNIGNEVIISFSEIVLPEAIEAAQSLGINIEECRIGGPHPVPFRVPIALRNKKYMKKLLKERALSPNPESQFKYWHNINTYKLKTLANTL